MCWEAMYSLEPTLPRQQQEPIDQRLPVPRPRSAAGSPRARGVVDLMVQPSPSQSRYPSAPRRLVPAAGGSQLQPQQHERRSQSANGTLLRRQSPAPGSAAQNASQVDALLRRLGELEETVLSQQVSEEKLKEVNVALMDRLTEFQRANETNVAQAEAELARIHCALQDERAARAAAEEAIARGTDRLKQERGAAASADEAAQSESAKASALSEQLRLLTLAKDHEGRVLASAERSLRRKYLLLLRARCVRQRRLRGLQGSVLAGPLLRSFRRRVLRGVFAVWTVLQLAEHLARRVERSERISWARRCFMHWTRWRLLGRMARRAMATGDAALKRVAFVGLRRAVELSRQIAAGLVRLGASSQSRSRRCVLHAWRASLRESQQHEDAAALHGASMAPRLRRQAAFRRWAVGAARQLMAEAAARSMLGSAMVHRLELSIERWRRQARRSAMGFGPNALTMRRARTRALTAGRADSFGDPAAAASEASKSGGRAARRAAMLQAMQANSLYFRARGCLVRWRAAARMHSGVSSMLRDAGLHALALSAAYALYWWRRLTRKHRHVRRRRQRAARIFHRRLELRVWRGWLRVVQLGRGRRDEEAKAVWEMAATGFTRWAGCLDAAQAKRRRRRTAIIHARRCRLQRGSAAFRLCGTRLVMDRIAMAQAASTRRVSERRAAAAALARWAIHCASEMRRRGHAVSSELQLRSELLAQSRAASAAVEDENDDLRTRTDSLANDMQALQQVCPTRRVPFLPLDSRLRGSAPPPARHRPPTRSLAGARGAASLGGGGGERPRRGRAAARRGDVQSGTARGRAHRGARRVRHVEGAGGASAGAARAASRGARGLACRGKAPCRAARRRGGGAAEVAAGVAAGAAADVDAAERDDGRAQREAQDGARGDHVVALGARAEGRPPRRLLEQGEATGGGAAAARGQGAGDARPARRGEGRRAAPRRRGTAAPTGAAEVSHVELIARRSQTAHPAASPAHGPSVCFASCPRS